MYGMLVKFVVFMYLKYLGNFTRILPGMRKETEVFTPRTISTIMLNYSHAIFRDKRTETRTFTREWQLCATDCDYSV